MPIALRLHLAADPELCCGVASAFIDAVFYVRVATSARARARPSPRVTETRPLRDAPVVMVSWRECDRVAKWLGLRRQHDIDV